MKITVAGSMSFARDMLEIKKKLEEKGHSIIIPVNTEKYVDGSIEMENKQEKIELDLIRKYFNEIKNCDGIFIINKDKNNIQNYIGGNSLIEMAFAHVLNKRIFLSNSIPQMSYSDEIEAMKPIIINGDLEKVK
jgi:hypothetical protein